MPNAFIDPRDGKEILPDGELRVLTDVSSVTDLPDPSTTEADVISVVGGSWYGVEDTLLPVDTDGDGTNDEWVSWFDGRVAREIPDSAIAQYDATQISGSNGDEVSTFEDEIGTYPLSGSAILRTGSNGINSNYAIDLSDVADNYSESSLSLSQPYTIIAVKQDGAGSANELAGDQSDGRPTLNVNSGGSSVSQINAGSALSGNTTNTQEILAGLYDGSSSEIRQNGSSTATGNAGTQGFDSGLHLGQYPNGRTGFDGLIGELIIYDKKLTSTEVSDEESRLSNKWGITI